MLMYKNQIKKIKENANLDQNNSKISQELQHWLTK